MGLDKNKNPEQVEIYICSKHSFICRIKSWSLIKREKSIQFLSF